MVDIFQRICKEVAGDVPLKVINDGEAKIHFFSFSSGVGTLNFVQSVCLQKVTALAAVQKLEGKGSVMGISMGSSTFPGE